MSLLHTQPSCILVLTLFYGVFLQCYILPAEVGTLQTLPQCNTVQCYLVIRSAEASLVTQPLPIGGCGAYITSSEVWYGTVEFNIPIDTV